MSGNRAAEGRLLVLIRRFKRAVELCQPLIKPRRYADQAVVHYKVFVLMENNLVGTNPALFCGEHDVIPIRSLQEISANLLSDLSLVARLERAKGVISLKDDDCCWNWRIDSQFRKDNQQRLAKLLEFGCHLAHL